MTCKAGHALVHGLASAILMQARLYPSLQIKGMGSWVQGSLLMGTFVMMLVS